MTGLTFEALQILTPQIHADRQQQKQEVIAVDSLGFIETTARLFRTEGKIRLEGGKKRESLHNVRCGEKIAALHCS